ncbi:tRNA ligase kinase domain-containing protein [Paraphysoderma sedebokerense]|nr:tRNA ligase kinase domain-containing protein [Paraphysoderma sedebokerense]
MLSNTLHDSTKVLLIPIATIASGKSTTGKLLSKLYGFGHIQNDNITVKRRGAQAFQNAILSEFESKRVVFADRNNHLFQHRKGLCDAVSAVYPDVWIVALNWGIPSGKEDEVLNVTAARVEARGENHQSLTPLRTENYRSILHNFINNRDPVSLTSPPDSRINDVIDLDVFSDIDVNFRKISQFICPRLGLSVASQHDIDILVEEIKNEKVTIIKHVGNESSRDGPHSSYQRRESQNSQYWQKREYYSRMKF